MQTCMVLKYSPHLICILVTTTLHWKWSKVKTAFVTPFGKYKFNAVPFGLAQLPAYFQQLISIVLQDCSEFVMAYLDDIIIFSINEQGHLKHIEVIFKKERGLKLKESQM